MEHNKVSNKKVLFTLFSVLLTYFVIEVVNIHHFKQTKNLAKNNFQNAIKVSQATLEIEYRLSAIRNILTSGGKPFPLAPNLMRDLNHHEQEIISQLEFIYQNFEGDKQRFVEVYQNLSLWFPLYPNSEIKLISVNQSLPEDTWLKTASILSKIQQTENDVLHFHRLVNKQAEQNSLLLFEYKNTQNTLYNVKLGFLLLIFSLLLLYVINTKKAQTKQKRLARLLEQNVMIAKVFPDGKVISVSQALCHYLGAEEQDIIGKQLNFFDNSDQQDTTYAKISTITKAGKAWEGQLKRKSELGEHQWFYSKLLPNFSEDFKIKSYTNIIVDTTNNHIAELDPLTEIGNKKSFESSISKTLRTSLDLKIDTCVGLIDINQFNHYIDQYGQANADSVLHKLACLYQQLIKGSRYEVFRLGGDVFAFILKDVDRAQASMFFDKLKRSVEDLQIAHKGNAKGKYLTVSFGMAHTTSKKGLNKEDLYLRAKKSLDVAKLSGS